MENENDVRSKESPTISFRSQFERFWDISPIHSCSYVAFRTSVYEAILWMIILLVAIGLCIYDVVGLLEKYYAEKTSVSVVFQRNQTMAFAEVAFCLDVYRHNLASSISTAFNELSFNASLHNVSMWINASAGIIDLSTLPATNADADIIMKTVYLLVTAIIDYDLGAPAGGGYDVPTSRAVQLVDAFFQQQGYGYVQLSQQTARYMCKQTYGGNCSISVSGDDNFCIDLCATANVTWIGYTMAFAPFDDICFALNTPAMNVFRSSGDIFVFENVFVSRISRLIAQWNEPILNLEGYGAPHLSFDLRGWQGFMDPREMDSVAMIAAANGFLIGVEIQTHFLAYNHSWGTCGNLQLSECALFNCLPAARMSADGCWPLAGYSLTASSKPSQMPVCGSRYSAAQIRQLGASYVGTWEKCLFETCTFPPCSAYEFDFSESLISFATSGVNATLFQGKLAYAVFQESLKMDFNTFMAELGGILTLFLGASLISIVHIPVFIICSCIYARQRRKRRVVLDPVFELRTIVARMNNVDIVWVVHDVVVG